MDYTRAAGTPVDLSSSHLQTPTTAASTATFSQSSASPAQHGSGSVSPPPPKRRRARAERPNGNGCLNCRARKVRIFVFGVIWMESRRGFSCVELCGFALALRVSFSVL